MHAVGAASALSLRMVHTTLYFVAVLLCVAYFASVHQYQSVLSTTRLTDPWSLSDYLAHFCFTGDSHCSGFVIWRDILLWFVCIVWEQLWRVRGCHSFSCPIFAASRSVACREASVRWARMLLTDCCEQSCVLYRRWCLAAVSPCMRAHSD